MKKINKHLFHVKICRNSFYLCLFECKQSWNRYWKYKQTLLSNSNLFCFLSSPFSRLKSKEQFKTKYSKVYLFVHQESSRQKSGNTNYTVWISVWKSIQRRACTFSQVLAHARRLSWLQSRSRTLLSFGSNLFFAKPKNAPVNPLNSLENRKTKFEFTRS